MSGTLVILSGPSGVGKDTVIEAWNRADPRVTRVVAYTTRPPRPGEKADVDYHFVGVEEFRALAESGAFLEWKEVHGNYYATPLTDMQRILDEGKVAVLKIDVQGALAAMRLRPDAISVFLRPPSFSELEARIRGRMTDSEEAIQKRLRNAQDELALAHHYQHQVVNDDLAEAVRRLRELVA